MNCPRLILQRYALSLQNELDVRLFLPPQPNESVIFLPERNPSNCKDSHGSQRDRVEKWRCAENSGLNNTGYTSLGMSIVWRKYLFRLHRSLSQTWQLVPRVFSTAMEVLLCSDQVLCLCRAVYLTKLWRMDSFLKTKLNKREKKNLKTGWTLKLLL